MVPMPLSRCASNLTLALLLAHAPIVREAVAQTPSVGQSTREYTARDADAQSQVLALTDEVIAFTGEGYRAIPPGEVLALMDSYRDWMRALATKIADTPAAAVLTTFLAQFERVRADIAAVQARHGLAAPGRS
jgi:hypothetical protein